MKKIDIELTYTQHNILAVALDHMWEHLDELDQGDRLVTGRLAELEEMQEKFKV